MTLAQTLTRRDTVRLDKRIVSLGFAAALGWLASNAWYHVGWLQYQANSLQEIREVYSPHSAISTPATIAKARTVAKQASTAVKIGCIPPAAPAAK